MSLVYVIAAVLAGGLVVGFFEEKWDDISMKLELNRIARESRRRMLSGIPNRYQRTRNPMKYGMALYSKKGC